MVSRIKSIIKKIKEKRKPQIEFLKKGTLGGIVLCIILATIFLYGNILKSMLNNRVLEFAASVVLVVIITELCWIITKILFGRSKQSKLFAFISFVMVLLSNALGTQGNALAAVFIMSLLLTLAVNYLGKCIWAFIKTKKFKQIHGYVVLVLSMVVVISYMVFWNSDSFGDNRILVYMENEPAYDGVVVQGFEQYLSNGSHKVGYISYGPENADIITDTLDISNIAKQNGLIDSINKMFSDYDAKKTPVAGCIWYPEDMTNCPVLFIVHGAHDSSTPSYLGYDYLGEYLASNGYVVVSVDENIVNSLGFSNDIRAIILLENIKTIFALNENQNSVLYGKMNEEQLAIAGHSRGGEMVATAYLFNDLDVYPENGNVKFDYHFQISSIIAIAPTVDQYMPVSHPVQIENVNYMILHGSNDQDVSKMMGEKQYNNVSFTDNSGDYCKASVYVMGANHGQFNTRWGRYDLVDGTNGFLNTNHFIDKEEQQLIAKAYFRSFLDATIMKDDTYKSLLVDNRPYRKYLPETVYVTNYMDSTYESILSFDDNVDLTAGENEQTKLECVGMKEWTVHSDKSGSDSQKENYVLDCSWEKASTPSINISMESVDLSKGSLSFRIADMREDDASRNVGLDYTVTLFDKSGNEISKKSPRYVFPSLAIQLYKQDAIFGSYEYKHQMQMVMINKETFEEAESFDFSAVENMKISFNGNEEGKVILDEVLYGGIENKSVIVNENDSSKNSDDIDDKNSNSDVAMDSDNSQVQDITELSAKNAYSCMYQNQEHKFTMYFPEDYDASVSHPLVIMLHGFGNTAESFATQTKFEKDACEEGYVVVYLTSTPDSNGDIGWNSGLGESDKDDVGYIKSLVAYIQDEYNCDINRTFAAGFSNGAFMTQRLAVDADDTFVAVASVAGMMPKLTWESKKEQANVGVLEIYGTKDDVVPMISNGSEKTAVAPAIENVMEYWSKANNLSEKTEEALSDKATCIKYSNQDKSQHVWMVTIEDGRHSWPDEGYCGFSTNKLILEFFDQY